MKKLGTIIILLLCCQAAWAQGGRQEMRLEQKLQQMDSLLDLSDAQRTSIHGILSEQLPKVKELHSSGASRDSVRNLMKETRERISEVLTEEQRLKFRELKGEGPAVGKGRKGRRGPAMGSPDSSMSAERSGLRDQRLEFDARLSDAERATIDQVREELKELRPERETMDSLDLDERRQRRAQHLEKLKVLDPIVTAHKAALDSLTLDMPKRGPARGRGIGQENAPEGVEHMKYYRFLLMKPREQN